MELGDLQAQIKERQEELEDYKAAVIAEETAAYRSDIGGTP